MPSAMLQISQAADLPNPLPDADATGNTFLNGNGATRLWLQNRSGAPETASVPSIRPDDQGFSPPEVIDVDPGEIKATRAFPVGRFGALPLVTYSAASAFGVVAVNSEDFPG